eukprot:XP_011661585.1 PREDICTED: F-BAR domain only protein 2 isoform X11 [Strongylocentrotus purpuratus]
MVRTTAKAQNAALRHSRINLFGSAKDLHKLQALQGEKNQGFGCLYNNMKHGQTSTKELGEFFKERSLIEDTYHKSVSKLAKSTSNCSQLGTFAPFWTVLKAATDKLAASHQKLVQKLQDIVKDIQKYGDEQHKKHKTVKIEVQGTADTVTNIQRTTDLVATAKELYNTRCIEFEKLKREGITGKELEKAETKYKKTLEEYKNLIDKYGNLREDFQKKMTDTCQKFEALEEAHLQQLKDFIKQYNIAIKDCHNSVQKVQREFTEQCEELTEVKLISMFSESKGTGKERPVLLEFEECDVSNIPMPDPETTKKKKKVKKAKKKKDKDGESPGNSPDMSTPQVDEEGFSIKPEDNRVEHQQPHHHHFYSDSDKSDSDSESEDRTRRIRVEIKPRDANLPKTTATVDEIKKSLGGLTLSPAQKRREKTNGDLQSRRQTALNRSRSPNFNLYCKKYNRLNNNPWLPRSLGISPTHYSRVYRNSWLRFSNQSNSAGNLLDLDLDFSSPPRNHTSNATTPDSALSPDLFSSSFGGDSFASPSPQTPVASSAGEATARPHSACIFRYSREYVRRPRSHTSSKKHCSIICGLV